MGRAELLGALSRRKLTGEEMVAYRAPVVIATKEAPVRQNVKEPSCRPSKASTRRSTAPRPISPVVSTRSSWKPRAAPSEIAAARIRFAQRIPMLVNMVEGDKTPVKSADELGAIGYRIVIFLGGTARAEVHTLQRCYASLHNYRTTTPMPEQMLDLDQLNDVIGTAALMEEVKKDG